MIYFQIFTTFRYKSLKNSNMLQEDLVTILSNKAGHCKQGSVISIVRGTKAEDVIFAPDEDVSNKSFDCISFPLNEYT